MGTIWLKCPNCGATLPVADSLPGSNKALKCPICGSKYPISEYKQIQRRNAELDRTSLNLQQNTEDKTQLPAKRNINSSCGLLFDNAHNREYLLKSGINLIGRKTYQTASLANIAIETDDLGFSRKHVYIEVIFMPDGSIRHYAYNASNKNETQINGIPLGDGDKVILHDADVIHSANTTLVFKVSEINFPTNSNDSDKTQI